MEKKIQKPTTVGVMFHRYGPYHICRINAVNKYYKATGFELSNITKEYKWDEFDKGQNFKRITIFKNVDSRSVSPKELETEIFASLDKNPVDVMLINGWGDKGALITLKWCLRNHVPTILMTEEVADTFKRTRVKEYIKSQVVKLFDAALVGGDAQKRYVMQLGQTSDKIELGYDVIDNHYFSEVKHLVSQNSEVYKKKYDLPENFFLTSNRFIPKKNLFRLLEAYKQYVVASGEKSWSLVMLGDGEQMPAIKQLVCEMGIEDKVILPGFLQYDDLPYYYALAKCFIHASTSEQWGLVVNEAMTSGLPVIVSSACGCQENLVRDNSNGYLFDPYDVNQLCEKMTIISNKTVAALQVMGDESRKIISNFDPEVFGKNTEILIDKLREHGTGPKSFLGKTILNTLTKIK